MSLLVAPDELLEDLVGSGEICLSPSTPVAAARDLFVERSLAAAAVIDERGVPVGILTATDLLAGGARVEEVMNPFVFALPARASLGQAAALMAYEGIRECVVLDGAGRFAGLITALDVAGWMGRAAGYVGLLDGGAEADDGGAEADDGGAEAEDDGVAEADDDSEPPAAPGTEVYAPTFAAATRGT